MNDKDDFKSQLKNKSPSKSNKIDGNLTFINETIRYDENN